LSFTKKTGSAPAVSPFTVNRNIRGMIFKGLFNQMKWPPIASFF
jgi:hypothetical protein